MDKPLLFSFWTPPTLNLSSEGFFLPHLWAVNLRLRAEILSTVEEVAAAVRLEEREARCLHIIILLNFSN